MSVFVSGSSRGLGEAFVEHYLAHKADVYGIGRSRLENPSYHYETVDVSDFKSLESSLEALFDGVKSLDLMILNAGVLGRIQDISLCEMEQLKFEMDVNMWANKVILDYVIKNKIAVKQVIAISSGASVNGSLGWNGYSLSKAALNMLIKLYASEMQETHLISLAPGLIQTDMMDSIIRGNHDVTKYKSVGFLQQSQKEGLILTPKTVVEQIVTIEEKILSQVSGEFIDIRLLD